ncbi:MAG: hypothetical protein IJE49_05375 [Agathobacter sp.]|nr:hypothetical protein [Agathobacter sp.]
MDNSTTTQIPHQAEDAALKVMHDYFAEVLLPYWNIPGIVDHVAPTESIYLELRKQYQDINIHMKDGTLIHFEFQSSDNRALDDLRRFRTYEAFLCMKHKTDVHTYVLFSGGIEHPMTEFTSGINTYRIHPIIMKGQLAEDIFENINSKLEQNIPLTEQDLVPLTICPLMGGDIPQKERFQKAFKIVRMAGESIQSLSVIEAVLYTMATKFLSQEELNSLKEEIKMTELGAIIYNDGISEGISQGISQNAIENARNLFINGVSFEIVCNSITGISKQDLKEIYEEITAKKIV